MTGKTLMRRVGPAGSALAAMILASACAGPAQTGAAGKTTEAANQAGAAANSQAQAQAAEAEVASLRDLAQNGPGKKDFPQADAVVKLERDDITLREGGEVVHHHKSIVRILDAQRGKAKFADVHIRYDSKRQDLHLLLARTVNADGIVHDASPEEISDILPPELEGATVYSGVMERVVSFPAVDAGSVVELEYESTTKAGPDASLGGETLLAQWDPVALRVVTVTAPAGVSPELAVVGTTLQPTETQDKAAGTHTFTFHLANLPDQQPEPGSPREEAVLPRLVYSFVPAWKQVEAQVAGRYFPAAHLTSVPASVRAQARKLVAGIKGKGAAARARALLAFVEHDIRSVDLPLGWAGYAPNPPDVVLSRRYGDARDKVGLLLALCAAEHIAGQPVLVRSGAVPVVKSVPTLAQFDRMVARLTLDGKAVWVDPTDENGQLGFAPVGQDNLVLALSPEAPAAAGLEQRAALDPASSVSHMTETYALDARGNLDAHYAASLTGWYAERAREALKPLKGERLTQYFQRTAAGLSATATDAGHEVGDLDTVSGPITVSQHVSAPDYTATQGRFRVFELPGPTLGFAADGLAVGMSHRTYPLLVGTPRSLVSDITVKVPAGWRVAYAPSELTGQAPGAHYSLRCTTQGRTVTCHQEVAFDKVTVAAADYDALHGAMVKLADYGHRVILLQR